jgi:hypothetical protein
MLTSVLKGHAFAGTLALPPRLRLVWPERYADAITDTVGQPLFNVGRYSGRVVDSLSRCYIPNPLKSVINVCVICVTRLSRGIAVAAWSDRR